MVAEAVDGSCVDERDDCGDRGQGESGVHGGQDRRTSGGGPCLARQNLRIMENLLETLRVAGFPPSVALDMLYSVSGFVVGHVATFSRAGDGRHIAAPDQMRSLNDIDPDEFPLLAEAARAWRAPGSRSRFDFALDAMLSGFEAARTARTPR
ncbi:TetR/AcrR family transcriptional regulator C-terminal domain-containing protein [Microtetraspora fusca]|uniref:TetR/AcrR family transcriptional regulator C-terminal domain-containing protein n=1 Tax=Microtetraspora fusca TaxID=1997 RepID=A0ABW6V4Y2_MICFU